MGNFTVMNKIEDNPIPAADAATAASPAVEAESAASGAQRPAATDPAAIKPDVLGYDDLRQMVPFFDGKPKLVAWLSRLFALDKVNAIHRHNMSTPGVPFTEGMLNDLEVTIDIRGEEHLAALAGQPFITVSNHPFGALDGIMLIKIVGGHCPDFKVMVNMILNHIGAMRPNFIAVDALASDKPEKRAVSMRGIAEAMRHVREGHPMGFFPAGAVSKLTRKLRIEDRAWQPSVIRIIQKMKVPVVPIYFHGHNSLWFTFLGMVDWRLRTLRLPAEVFRRKGDTFRVSIGEPIMPDRLAEFPEVERLGEYLKEQTYSMKQWTKK